MWSFAYISDFSIIVFHLCYVLCLSGLYLNQNTQMLIMFSNIFVISLIQSREKFVSLKKNTPEDVVAELEEVCHINFCMISSF